MKPNFFILAFIFFALFACEDSTLPKPYGEVRLEYKRGEYRKFNKPDCPFTFEYSENAYVKPKNDSCHFNLYYPDQRATLYMDYEPVDNNLPELLKDAEKSVYEPHTKRATFIEPKVIIRERDKVFGTLYKLGGESALNIQFHVTDSTRNFLRGSLYFKVHPKPDSLSPAVDFLQQDIMRMMETIKWRN